MARRTEADPDSWPVLEEDTLVGRGAPPPPPAGYYPPPEPPPDHRLGTGMLLGILTVLLVGAGIGLAWFLTHRDSKNQVTTVLVSTPPPATTATTPAAVKKVAVPRLVGLKEQQALLRLGRLGLRPKEVFRPSKKQKGVVISQKPQEGREVKKGSTVTLMIDGGAKQVAMPQLTGRSIADARVVLRKLGLQSTITQVTSHKEAGTVVDQAPKSGAKLAKGSYVTLSVAKATPEQTTTTTPAATTTPATTTAPAATTTAPTPAPQPTTATMPDVTNQTEAAAAQAMSSAELLASIFFVPGSDPLGTVEQQAKPAGTKVAYHAHVQINVSSGPGDKEKETVPNVIGKTLQDAVSSLNAAHLRLIFVKLPVTTRSQAGKVVQQSPLGGNHAPQNAQVLVFLGAFKD